MAHQAIRSAKLHDVQTAEELAFATNNFFLPQTAPQFHSSDNYPILPPGVMFPPQYYDSTGHSFAPEAAVAQILDRNLRSDPGYRPPNQTRDFFTPKPAKTILRWKTTPWQDLVKRTPEIKDPTSNVENDPLVHSYLPGGDPWEMTSTFNVSEAKIPQALFDMNYPPQPRSSPSHTRAVSQDPILGRSQDGGHVLPGRGNYAPPHDCTYHNLPNKPAVGAGPCPECSLAHVKCEMILGSRCRRCTSLMQKQLSGPPEHAGFIGHVVVFEMGSIQVLLSDLRDEAGQLTSLQPGVTLEDLFDGTMFCHMGCSVWTQSGASKSSVPVVMRHLATTKKAKQSADLAKLTCPLPALNAEQMDSFIDIGNRMCDLECLQPLEKNVIISALRCSDYLGILFNWDQNSICYQEGSRGASVSQAKNLVLETVFSFAYRVQELLKILSHEVIKSLTEPENPDHDPATISCALWIVYSSLNTFRKLKWDAKSLQNLKKFLNGLHARAPAAVKALERYRREVAFKRCGRMSQNLKTFKKLVDAKTVPKSTIAFTYERHSYLMGLLPQYSQHQSYTDVLESPEYDSTYLGTYRFPEAMPEEIQEHPAAGHSTPYLEDLQKRDGTLTWNSQGSNVGSCECSLASDSSSTNDAVPPLTMKTTIEDSETGLDAEISRAQSYLRYLGGLKTKAIEFLTSTTKEAPMQDVLVLEPIQPRSSIASHFSRGKITHGEEAVLPDTARTKQQLGRQKQKRAYDSVTSKTPSVASGSSSHRSPQPKRQRRQSPKPHVPSEGSKYLEFERIPDLSEIPDIGEGGFTAFFLDHQFNPDFMRND